MKHIIVMSIMVVIAGAIIGTGLWQQSEEQKRLEFERLQRIAENNNNPPINKSQEEEKDTDPFGLFGPEETVYRLTFHALWNAQDHDPHYITTAHFSRPVVTVGPTNPLFTLGEQASEGIKELAEEGRTRSLKKELEEKLNSGEIHSFSINERVPTPASVSYEITVDRDNPVVSLVSNLGPSPDWFVALEGYNLLEDGRWKKEAQIPLLVLDAGTEEGAQFRVANEATTPQGVIGELTDIPAISLPPFAVVEFTQLGYEE